MALTRKIGLGLVAILIAANVFAWNDVRYFARPRLLRVAALDIGQGDAIFIETPDFRHILIDGGPGGAVLGKLQERLPLWERKLDVVMLTHPDADHLNGLLQVLQKYQVDYIVWTGMVREGQGYETWLSLLQLQRKRGAHIVIAHEGTDISNNQVSMDILSPQETIEGEIFPKGANDTSIVSRLSYGEQRFLFTGDISSEVEEDMVQQQVDLVANVLKVPHHGSKYSSSAEFLAAVHPALAMISVGATNTYGHPTSEVLQRLADFGITTARTDEDGDVLVTTDGKYINYTTDK